MRTGVGLVLSIYIQITLVCTECSREGSTKVGDESQDKDPSTLHQMQVCTGVI